MRTDVNLVGFTYVCASRVRERKKLNSAQHFTFTQAVHTLLIQFFFCCCCFMFRNSFNNFVLALDFNSIIFNSLVLPEKP